MTAPWARCAKCDRDLYPRLARRTEEGWACANRHSCGKAEAIRRSNVERAEDLAWMAATGETFDGAAERLGMTRAALDAWSRTHAPELAERLRRNGRAA